MTVKRVLKLSDQQMSRIQADLEADSADLIGEIIAEALARLALKRVRCWNEIKRMVSLDEETETVMVSFAANEIVVKEKCGESDTVTQFRE